MVMNVSEMFKAIAVEIPFEVGIGLLLIIDRIGMLLYGKIQRIITEWT